MLAASTETPGICPMPPRDQTVISDALRRLGTLVGLNGQQLEELAGEAQTHDARQGACLRELGDRDPHLMFLLDGELQLTAADGASHVVRAEDAGATGPVSRLRPSRYRITARTDVCYLLIDQQLLDEVIYMAATESMVVEDSLQADSISEPLDDIATHPLVSDVFQDLNRGRILVPSEPGLAIRVGRSLNLLGGNPVRVADTLALCPALALKVVRAAKVHGGRQAAMRSLRTAVHRLGLEQTFSLAVNCVLRESLRSSSPTVQAYLKTWRERTVRVGAISAVLARINGRFDPEFARLIGLLHCIADPVLLGYADRYPELADASALEQVIHRNRAELGRLLLTMWDLPREVVDAATFCNQWDYDHPGEPDYTDVILVARWHATIGARSGQRPPPLEDIPAFRRLGIATDSPELSLKVVESAQESIDRAHALLIG
jgi:HD-like signal output (HDOD) protein/CRP-like cAMP-binding protein